MKTKPQVQPFLSRRWVQMTLFIFAGVISVAVIVVAIISVVTPQKDLRTQEGVGADGFRAFIEDNGNLGVGAIVTKDQVVSALGGKATSVSDGQVDKVFNLNGDRAQEISFPFTRADGKMATLYIDLKLYKNMQSLEDDHIYVATADAGKINGHPAYYKMAQTIGSEREYHLMVVNGLKAYRFVLSQPANNLTIDEASAFISLKKLALSAKL